MSAESVCRSPDGPKGEANSLRDRRRGGSAEKGGVGEVTDGEVPYFFDLLDGFLEVRPQVTLASGRRFIFRLRERPVCPANHPRAGTKERTSKVWRGRNVHRICDSR